MFSVRTWNYVILKVKIMILVILKVGRKTCELVIWKTRKITCISYLEMNRTCQLVNLYSEAVDALVI